MQGLLFPYPNIGQQFSFDLKQSGEWSFLISELLEINFLLIIPDNEKKHLSFRIYIEKIHATHTFHTKTPTIQKNTVLPIYKTRLAPSPKTALRHCVHVINAQNMRSFSICIYAIILTAHTANNAPRDP